MTLPIFAYYSNFAWLIIFWCKYVHYIHYRKPVFCNKTILLLSMKKSTYRPVRKKYDIFKLKIFINKKFWKTFYFFTCILTNYVAHDITKEFWKNSHFENMTAGFLLRCQNWLRYEISLIWHWNIDLLKQNWSFVYVKIPNDD